MTAADRRRAERAAVEDRVSRALAAIWADIAPEDDFNARWSEGIARRVIAALAAAQRLTAETAAAYVAAALQEQGAEPSPAATMDPAAFAGTAADGRPLATGAYLALVTARRLIGAGRAPTEALAVGGRRLVAFGVGETGNAASLAESAALCLDRAAVGYVRQTRGGSCPICLGLAGTTFRRNAGFSRHGGCDCVHVPAATAGPPPSAAALAAASGLPVPGQVGGKYLNRKTPAALVAFYGDDPDQLAAAMKVAGLAG